MWRVLLTVMAAALALAAPAAAQDAPWLGAWRLDVGRSDWGPVDPPYSRATWTITPIENDDRLRMVYELVGVRGGVTRMEWTGRFDGGDYPMHGPDTPVTYAYRQVDPLSLQVTVKVDGSVAASSKVTLSPDGRTLTADTETGHPRFGNIRNVAVYTKK